MSRCKILRLTFNICVRVCGRPGCFCCTNILSYTFIFSIYTYIFYIHFKSRYLELAYQFESPFLSHLHNFVEVGTKCVCVCGYRIYFAISPHVVLKVKFMLFSCCVYVVMYLFGMYDIQASIK